MTRDEIKKRQMTNQFLLQKGEKHEILKAILGVQAQFMSNALHSLRIRCQEFDENTISRGLIKSWTVRGTVHVFSEGDLPLFIHCQNGESYRKNEWNGYRFWNRRDIWALSPERQKFFSSIILSALEDGKKTRDELKALCRKNGMTEGEEGSMFDAWGGGLRELCERGFLHYTAEEKKTFSLSPAFKPIPEEDAKLEMMRRYFTNFGPATIHDAMYFFHMPAKEVRAIMAKLPLDTTECEGRTYYFIENGRSYDAEIPDCIFLAGFDQLMLGYRKTESLYLAPEHLRRVFNLAGIVMPTVLLHGNVVGTWKMKQGKLSISPFEPLTEETKRNIQASAECLWKQLKAITFTE